MMSDFVRSFTVKNFRFKNRFFRPCHFNRLYLVPHWPDTPHSIYHSKAREQYYNLHEKIFKNFLQEKFFLEIFVKEKIFKIFFKNFLYFSSVCWKLLSPCCSAWKDASIHIRNLGVLKRSWRDTVSWNLGWSKLRRSISWPNLAQTPTYHIFLECALRDLQLSSWCQLDTTWCKKVEIFGPSNFFKIFYRSFLKFFCTLSCFTLRVLSIHIYIVGFLMQCWWLTMNTRIKAHNPLFWP